MLSPYELCKLCDVKKASLKYVKSPGVGPQASLYPVAPGTLFHETTAVLVVTADTFRV